jgi:hypothetical protein
MGNDCCKNDNLPTNADGTPGDELVSHNTKEGKTKTQMHDFLNRSDDNFATWENPESNHHSAANHQYDSDYSVKLSEKNPDSSEPQINIPRLSVSYKFTAVPIMNPVNEAVQLILNELGPYISLSDSTKVLLDPKNGDLLGPFSLDDQSTYYGQFTNPNTMTGYGTQVWLDGTIYEGQFSSNKTNGQGRLIKTDGTYLNGQFKDGFADGYGEITTKNQIYYKGTWKNNCREGSGEEYYEDQSYYKGEFKKDRKNGNGAFFW